ncbi:PRTRC system protein F [Caenimonas sedimenti]|uniref:PRTRC system protein F n=1 Tax=Caenimonas sedimenti TaxID=2596921 RepID=A0A562ZSZ1_9BURK|nr:PRTRC system protein F [Caenimonas sedimenti]TWO71491.1 PRTRC system protein F [Caenimonas sedimenti]
MSTNYAQTQHRSALPGCFCLPALDEAIPTELTNERGRRRSLARFAQASEKIGVPLPSGTFTSIEQMLEAQWSGYATSVFAHLSEELAPAKPYVTVRDDRLEVAIGACSGLSVYRLKPVIEALEAAEPGIGWFVHSVLDKCRVHGHEIYDLALAGYVFYGHIDMHEFTDEAYARALLWEEGVEPPEDGPLPPDQIEEMRGNYGMWPSDTIADAGGFKHLYGYVAVETGPKSARGETDRRPKVASDTKVRQWLRANGGHQLQPAVDVALRLKTALAMDKDRAFVWHSPRDPYQGEDWDPMGALALLTWDDPGLLIEAVEHHEQNLMNGGQAIEAFARTSLPLSAATRLTKLVDLASDTKQYLQRWSLLAELLSHLPLWEGRS